MSTTDIRPERLVIDAECVETALTPISNPHRFSTIASAVIVLGTGAGFLTNLHGSPASKTVNVAVLLAAIAVYVFFLLRAQAWEGR
jgi:hypothetical protein